MRISVTYRKRPWFASDEVLRRREFRVFRIGPWRIIWWGKDHWSENL